MTIQELHNYIDRTLGNNVRCLLSSFWWKKLFHLVVEKVDEVDTKIADLPTKKYVDDAVSNVSINVDDDINEYSENPVQNKVIKEYVDSKEYGPVFVVGLDANTGDVYLSDEDFAQNAASYAKIKNKVPCKGTISFYTIIDSHKVWFYSITCPIVFKWIGYSFANIRIETIYGMEFFANQPIDVLLEPEGLISICPSIDIMKPTVLFINTTSAVYKRHNYGVYAVINRYTMTFPILSIIEVNTNGIALFPAKYNITRNNGTISSFNISIVKDNVEIQYRLNSDGTMTEIS